MSTPNDAPERFASNVGPFDDNDSDEAWRNHSTGVYTGDGFVKSSGPPSAREQARRRDFWDSYDAQSVAAAAAAAAAAHGQRRVLGQPPPAASEEPRFPDALPDRSILAPRPLAPAPLPASAPASALVSSPPVRSGPSPPHSSDVDGEYDLDDDYLPDAPQGPPAPTSANMVHRPQVPRTSSPRAVEDWDDENLLTLWKHKVIRKKGYEPMLTSFENQTVESLHEAWTTYKERCKMLGATWEAASKPSGPLSKWFEE
ncbi:hypothetical protein E8E11_005152 [Didymella keratinophila]|nr:hypothetical protein E8E11_005152 [Didymella keratinophila]